MLRALGHAIVPALPSLFSFKIDDLRLLELAGVSSQSCVVRLVIPPEVLKGDLKHLVRPTAAATFTQRGPLLVTHQGLSGPAVLKLSAFGAKILAALRYSFTIEVSWVPNVTIEDVVEHLVSSKKTSPIALVGRGFPPMALALDEDDVPYTPTRGTEEGVGALSRRLWLYLLGKAGVSADKRWIDLSLKEVRSVAKEVTKCSLQVTGEEECAATVTALPSILLTYCISVGRGVYRDEFVTCGGVSLQEASSSE
jgi:predicted flavoprotein YhiN